MCSRISSHAIPGDYKNDGIKKSLVEHAQKNKMKEKCFDTGYIELHSWMSHPSIQKARFWDICFPGTHNSASWQLCESSERGFSGLVFNLVKQYVTCQNLNIYEQLMLGARFLDLRVCRFLKQNGEAYCAHGGFRTISLSTVLEQIARFLSKHSTEVIILSIRRDIGFMHGKERLEKVQSDHYMLLYLKRFLGSRLTSDITFERLVKRRQNVIYFFEEREYYLSRRWISDVMATVDSEKGFVGSEKNIEEIGHISAKQLHRLQSTKQMFDDSSRMLSQYTQVKEEDSVLSNHQEILTPSPVVLQQVNNYLEHSTQEKQNVGIRATTLSDQSSPLLSATQREAFVSDQVLSAKGIHSRHRAQNFQKEEHVTLKSNHKTPHEVESQQLKHDTRLNTDVTYNRFMSKRIPFQFSRHRFSRNGIHRSLLSGSVTKAVRRQLRSNATSTSPRSVTNNLLASQFGLVRSDTLPFEPSYKKTRRRVEREVLLRHEMLDSPQQLNDNYKQHDKSALPQERSFATGDKQETASHKNFWRTRCTFSRRPSSSFVAGSHAVRLRLQQLSLLKIHKNRSSDDDTDENCSKPLPSDRSQVGVYDAVSAIHCLLSNVSKPNRLNLNRDSLGSLDVQQRSRRGNRKKIKSRYLKREVYSDPEVFKLQSSHLNSVGEPCGVNLSSLACGSLSAHYETISQPQNGLQDPHKLHTVYSSEDVIFGGSKQHEYDDLSRTPQDDKNDENDIIKRVYHVSSGSDSGSLHRWKGVCRGTNSERVRDQDDSSLCDKEGNWLTHEYLIEGEYVDLKNLSEAECRQHGHYSGDNNIQFCKSIPHLSEDDHCYRDKHAGDRMIKKYKNVSFDSEDRSIPEEFPVNDIEQSAEFAFRHDTNYDGRPSLNCIQDLKQQKMQLPRTIHRTAHEHTPLQANCRVKKVMHRNSSKSPVNYNDVERIKYSYFFSPFLPGQTYIIKSWSVTNDVNPAMLCRKLRYWSVTYGMSKPRKPFLIRILAGEITPPSLEGRKPSVAVLKFWTTQGACAVFMRKTGLQAAAIETHRLLLKHVLDVNITGLVNGITHDYLNENLVEKIVHLNIENMDNQLTTLY